MSRLPSGFWGPPPHWALIPLVAVGLVLGGVAARQPKEGDEPVTVTALKPVGPTGAFEGTVESESAAADGPVGMPIEVRYGVPSPRTARLWSEPRPD